MNKRYKFKYRSKALNTLYVSLQNLMLGLLSFPVLVLITLLFNMFGINALDNVFLFLAWALIFIVFAVFQTVYWTGHKGVTVTDDKLIINYCCIVPPVHMFKKEILIKGIESAEFCTEPVNQRIEEVEGGAYNEPYVLIKYGYGGRKEVRLPLQNAEEFIKQITEYND
ncbi:MAG: hypothetical protein E7571_02955 [Ruminococcaceae bacterium]|nr:hypothetical protein [Oscillospiraceae bacterium]